MVPPSTVKQFYQLFPFSNNQEKIKALLLKNKISENLTHSGQIMLTSVQANTLSQCSELDSITVVIDSRKEKGIGGIDNTKLHWTFSNYGEYIVPYKGMQITLNDTTIDCYKEIMIRDEKLKWNNRMKYFEVNSNPISNYTFRHNYYFMMGDNRNYSIDSRGWGVVADHHIIGKASLVLYSQKAGVFMKRLLKPINTH